MTCCLCFFFFKEGGGGWTTPYTKQKKKEWVRCAGLFQAHASGSLGQAQPNMAGLFSLTIFFPFF